MENTSNKRKASDLHEPASTSSVVTQFKTLEGKNVGPQLELPITSSVLQLEQVVHQLLSAESNNDSTVITPYSFYLKDTEILESLQETLKSSSSSSSSSSTESTLEITLHPLALFKVRPVTRNTQTLSGHAQAILSVQFSPDGKSLASAGGDATVRFWDLNTGTPRFKTTSSQSGHKSHVLSMAWSPNGKTLATGDYKGMLCLWNPTNGSLLGGTKPSARGNHTQWITSISWQPFHTNPKCEFVATASKDCGIRIWHAPSHSLRASLSSHTGSVEDIVWGGEGLLYSASRDRTIKIWAMDYSSGNKIQGRLVKTLTGHGHRINTLALNTSVACRTGPFDPEHPDLNSESEGHALAKYQTSLRNGGGVEILVSGSDDHTLFLWKDPMSSGVDKKIEPIRMTGHVQPVNDLKYSPDGRYVASASFDKKIKVWDGKTGKFIRTLTGHVGAIYKVAWSSDSRFIVSASKDSTMKLWDFKNPGKGGAPKTTLPGHFDEVYALDWAPSSGNKVATGSKDRTIKIWQH